MSASCDSHASSELADSVAYLCAKQCFAFAQLDDTFRTLWRHGDLAHWITPGENVCTSTELFFGMEGDFLNMQDEDGARLVLPRVGLPQSQGVGNAKISVEVLWDDTVERYHIVIHRLTGESELELELLRQIRARRLAEQHMQSAQARLAEREMLLNVLMEEAPVALALFDTDMRYLFATRRWVSDFHLEGQPLIGRSHYEAMPPLLGDIRQKHEACLAGAVPAPEIEALDWDEHAPRWVRWTHRPWQRADDTPGGMLTVAEDLTVAIEEQRELERRNQCLRAANHRLGQFAAIVTHDFNAPLRSLENAVGELQGQERTVEGLRQRITRMRAMINGVQDFCLAEHVRGHTERVDVLRLLTEIASALPQSAGFHIEMRADAEAIIVHAAALDLVLRNLLSNAIQHHDHASGHIVFSLKDDADAWLLELADDGPGIPPAHHAAIFDPFTRFGGNGATSGQGLGLTIVKRALDSVGASITVCSSPPERRGCTFSIRWPKPQFFHKNSP